METLLYFLNTFRPSLILRRTRSGFFWAYGNQIAFLRWFYYIKILRKLNFDVNRNTTLGVSYSREQFGKFTPLARIYNPIFAMMCIPTELNKRLLILGPRYENEIYIARSLGFDLKSISTLDTFSYSPLVDIGDMHEMNFPDNEFSYLLCSWTLSYSANPKQAAKEMMRVTSAGGLIAISVEKVSEIQMLNGVPGILKGSERIQTRAQLQELFVDCEIKIILEPIATGMLICILQKKIPN
ncbi:ubiquinone/menaquinone biosynthesis methyltransferase [Candidatus Planktophila dulcis]|uniref:class I SAM-dependent methyltransferase n=1 Tax=Candidatus Planktophila dulcis TaxID=1884914 RepID=UPI000BACBB77|nr:methyltransferase domain-containing protein [Candidatus Planktophila dulcis]ASY20733.1 ubiquinone/menaquinone biosynthesis methyltransferase [Candidatus Planktophila dulcis]